MACKAREQAAAPLPVQSNRCGCCRWMHRLMYRSIGRIAALNVFAAWQTGGSQEQRPPAQRAARRAALLLRLLLLRLGAQQRLSQAAACRCGFRMLLRRWHQNQRLRPGAAATVASAAPAAVAARAWRGRLQPFQHLRKHGLYREAPRQRHNEYGNTTAQLRRLPMSSVRLGFWGVLSPAACVAGMFTTKHSGPPHLRAHQPPVIRLDGHRSSCLQAVRSGRLCGHGAVAVNVGEGSIGVGHRLQALWSKRRGGILYETEKANDYRAD